MMSTTYFIHTTVPLRQGLQSVCAREHKAITGNEIAIMINVAGTEALVKIKTDKVLADLWHKPFTPIAVYTDLDQVRALLRTPEWEPKLVHEHGGQS